MFKQIFNKSDGSPKLIQSVFDDETGVERFVYDESEYTEEMPSSELYEPITYRNGKWQGISYDEWLYNQSVDEDLEQPEHEPTEADMMLAQTQIQLAKTTRRLNQSEVEQAKLTLELMKKEQRLDNLEKSHAKTLLELTKMKGE